MTFKIALEERLEPCMQDKEAVSHIRLCSYYCCNALFPNFYQRVQLPLSGRVRCKTRQKLAQLLPEKKYLKTAKNNKLSPPSQPVCQLSASTFIILGVRGEESICLTHYILLCILEIPKHSFLKHRNKRCSLLN